MQEDRRPHEGKMRQLPPDRPCCMDESVPNLGQRNRTPTGGVHEHPGKVPRGSQEETEPLQPIATSTPRTHPYSQPTTHHSICPHTSKPTTTTTTPPPPPRQVQKRPQEGGDSSTTLSSPRSSNYSSDEGHPITTSMVATRWPSSTLVVGSQTTLKRSSGRPRKFSK